MNIEGYKPVSIETNLSSFQLIDQNYCQVLDGTPATQAQILYNDPHQYFGTNTLACTYNPFTFRTPESVQEFYDQYVKPFPPGSATTSPYYVAANDTSYDQAQIFLCSRLSGNCDNGEEYCTMFHDTTDVGQYCRQADPLVMDEAKIAVCASHDVPECGCLRKNQDSDYIVFRDKLDPSVPDECWYEPCFISSDPLRLSTDPIPTTDCPDENKLKSESINIFSQNFNRLSLNTRNTIPILDLPRQVQGTLNHSSAKTIPSANEGLIAAYITLGIMIGIIIILMFFVFYKM